MINDKIIIGTQILILCMFENYKYHKIDQTLCSLEQNC